MKTLITYLVEDNATVLENLIEALREIADVKVTAHSATQAEASRWLDMHVGAWHLAIVDLFLKEGSGLGVLAGCRNREAYQKVVVLTNYHTPETVSYTHLRAHETDSYLVCRLLLEKKKKNKIDTPQ